MAEAMADKNSARIWGAGKDADTANDDNSALIHGAGVSMDDAESTNSDLVDGPRGDELANATVPTIAGTTTEGETLTTTPGTYIGYGTPSITRQWRRADNDAGLNEVNIAGATGLTYLLAAADATKRIRVRETATNSRGDSVVANSAYTAAITGL